MSVPVRERGESPVEFLDLARKIRVETLRYCLKLPKRLTFYMGTDSKTSHNGKKWVSEIDGNVWEPGVYGWVEVIATD